MDNAGELEAAQVAVGLRADLASFLQPLLAQLDAQIGRRLLRTFARTVDAILCFRSRPHGLLLSELGPTSWIRSMRPPAPQDELLRRLSRAHPPVGLRRKVLVSAEKREVPHAGKRKVALTLALAVAAIGVGTAAASATGVPLPFITPDRTAVKSFIPTTFVEKPIAAGMVSKAQAIATALRHTDGASAGVLKPGVQVSAQFGTYSDSLFHPRPVWLITFFGPGVNLAPEGSVPRPGMQSTIPPSLHEENVVIDGPTGQYLEAYALSGR